MDQRAAYLIQILEQIGSPLLVSVTETDDTDEKEAAQKTAELLAKSVQVSIDMANMSDLAAAGVQDDSLRVALAALASSFVAEHYKQSKKVPDDNEIKKIISALQAVMTFSENFTPSPENTERLKELEAKGKPVDTHQTGIQYIQAFTPVVNAVGAFPFGQAEQKLITEIASRLTARASNLRQSILGTLSNEDDNKFLELAILAALAKIYTACHTAETSRLMGMSQEEQTSSEISIEPVWQAFDMRISMLETLAKNLLPGAASEKQALSSDKIAAPPTTPPAAEPTKEPKPEEKPAPSEPVTEAPPVSKPEIPAEKPAPSDNPMAMFAKPKSGGEDAEEPETKPPPEPPQEPPLSETSPPETPTPQDETPPAESDSNSDTQSGNPMSFFKTPPKDSSKDDES